MYVRMASAPNTPRREFLLKRIAPLESAVVCSGL